MVRPGAHLIGMPPDELAELVSAIGAPKFTLRQILHWIYRKGVTDIAFMTNLSLKHRDALATIATGEATTPIERYESADGTVKYLHAIDDGGVVESALIPDGKRLTLCLSTQLGCRRRCAFCDTGKMGLIRNLAAWEILGQYASIPERTDITNIVYMGMGEPLDNIEATVASLEACTSEWGYRLSPRRITVSTVGILPELDRLLEESDCNIALSLHSPDPERRKMVVPAEAKYPVHQIISTIRKAELRRQRRFSVEYVVFAGFNDRESDVEGIARLLAGLRCRINLISYNHDDASTRSEPSVGKPSTRSVGGSHGLQPASREMMEDFQSRLSARGFRVTIRASRGNDIAAACGRLTTRRFLSDQALNRF